jgi:putative copper export protein
VFLPVDALVLALRALSFTALVQAAGATLFLLLIGERDLDAATLARIRNLARIAAIAALCLVTAHFLLTPGQMAGDIGRSFDASLGSLLLRSNEGIANIVRVVGLSLLFICLDRATRANAIGAGVGAGLALLSFALTGHTSIHPARLVLAPLLLVHLVIAAAWLGALLPLGWVVQSEPAERAAALLERCARVGAKALPVLALCGVVLGAVLIGSWRGVATAYGAFVIGKTLAFCAAAGAAALGTWRGAAQLRRRGPDAAPAVGSSSARLGRAALREWLLVAAIVAGTAIMTSVTSPEHLGSAFGVPHGADGEHD